jgi:hypothetical protein
MYLFNPENDLALANFTPNYTPPASAIRMAEELAVLPIWYGGEDVTGKNNCDTKVVAGGELNRSFLEAVKKILPVEASLVSFSDIALYPHLKIVPWGWNPALRRKLISEGVSQGLLPSPEELACLRKFLTGSVPWKYCKNCELKGKAFVESLISLLTQRNCISGWNPYLEIRC